jgi:hypothetical protein
MKPAVVRTSISKIDYGGQMADCTEIRRPPWSPKCTVLKPGWTVRAAVLDGRSGRLLKMTAPLPSGEEYNSLNRAASSLWSVKNDIMPKFGTRQFTRDLRLDVLGICFEFSYFEIVSDFDIRISDLIPACPACGF